MMIMAATKTKETMDLKTWRHDAAHGKYLQTIHVELRDVNAARTKKLIETEPVSEPNNNDTTDGSTSDATPSTPETSLTPKRLKRRAKPSAIKKPNEEKDPHTRSVPPFTSAQLQTHDRMIMNVGGPVWAMDWLPSFSSNGAGSSDNKENECTIEDPEPEPNTTSSSVIQWNFLAVATHPPCEVDNDGNVVKNTPPDHYFDKPEAGRNLIQIWAVPIVKTAVDTEPTLTPKLVYAIDHTSGVTWDLQWCPVNLQELPKHCTDGLGFLAVCFGDGSLQVFQVPAIPEARLACNDGCVVETLAPVAMGTSSRAIQMSVKWSPHRWYHLLSGGSDGSISLWNIEQAFTTKRTEESLATTMPLEPQCRFQDVDTVGKQELFDWGWGWVAVRSLAWSPFDEFIFATTGNDSTFKVWDIREPRLCLRSHRLRSTWGLSLHWMDATSIEISGDQGAIFVYDILTGGYQKLHYHPQVDSPVWDLQIVRRGAVPLLASVCAAGSIRMAPAKKIYRAQQHAIEICRLAGEPTASIETPYKKLVLDLEVRKIDGASQGQAAASSKHQHREFRERDAALHRVRVSSDVTGKYPCLLAAAGHAGLVIVMEMQEELDSLLKNHFLPPNKKIGRPKKAFGIARAGQAWTSKKKSTKKKMADAMEDDEVEAGEDSLGFRSFRKARAMHPSLRKQPKKPPRFPQFEMHSDTEEEEEDEEDESEASSSISLSDDDDDDHVRTRFMDEDEEMEFDDDDEAIGSPATSQDDRMRHKYQLDLCEEDAIRLAIQLSEMESSTVPSAPVQVEEEEETKPTPVSANAAKRQATKVTPAEQTKTAGKRKSLDHDSPSAAQIKKQKKTTETPTTPVKRTAKAGRDKKTKPEPLKSQPSKSKKRKKPTTAAVGSEPKVTIAQEQEESKHDEPAKPAGKKKRQKKKQKTTTTTTEKEKATSPKQKPSRKPTSKAEETTSLQASKKPKSRKKAKAKPAETTDTVAPDHDTLDQETIHLIEYQLGMTEEDALREAIRQSELGVVRRSGRSRRISTGTALEHLMVDVEKKGTPNTKK